MKPCLDINCPEFKTNILHLLENHFYFNKENREKILKLLKEQIKKYDDIL